MKRLWRIAKRIWQVVKEMAWIVGFLVLVLPALERHPLIGQDKHSIRSSVRSNDSVKVDVSLPWVAEYEAPPRLRQVVEGDSDLFEASATRGTGRAREVG